MKTLYLIDGYAAIFRAYYAIRNPLHSPVTGEPTQATMVFANMLVKLYTTLAPDYVVVAWDTPGETFRDALYGEYAKVKAAEGLLQAPAPRTAGGTAESGQPRETTVAVTPSKTAPPAAEDAASPEDLPPVAVEPTAVPASIPLPPGPTYKGTRRDTPDDLNAQVPRIVELLNVFQIPIIGQPQWEADDIIATLTTRLLRDPAHSDVRVRIATRDKDMEQLINDRVTLFDIHTGAELTQSDLREKRGIAPSQVIDFLSLTGDSVDNIPGVPGIGPKTAAKLLQQFGTLDAILQAVAQPASPAAAPLTEKLRATLAQSQATLPLSRRLVTLETAADFPFALDDARARSLSEIAPQMLAFCDALGFNSLKKPFLIPSSN